ncbi:hypothetical protein [Sinomonas humi]|uniref:Uncharacterized protein n=1 Tax=Sinomonas humi TaxID=1338436 RepID=A0A0B2AL58_9MICC|nr:hypothetical protein [Sinomonas humi]KHL02571.1 hypothetical protein LK10_12205 [Sinomonas humi]
MPPRTHRVTDADALEPGDAVVVLFQGSHALGTVIGPSGDGALLLAEKENGAALRVDPRLTVVLRVPGAGSAPMEDAMNDAATNDGARNDGGLVTARRGLEEATA